VYESLSLPPGNLGPLARPRKLAAIDEAVLWPRGPAFGDRVFTRVYEFPSLGFEVGVEKPGKEVFENPPNVNDMLPSIYQHGRRWDLAPSFFDLYQEFQLISREARGQPLELMGCLLYRASYMLDHEFVDGGWRWKPPEDVMQTITESIPHMAGLPVEVFLTMVEVVALQEDVKYQTLGYDVSKGAGRTNNLQTCAHLIAAFLGRINIVRFAGSLARPPAGVAPLPQTRAKAVFPLLQSG
jgi:hypothetical protein